MNKLVKKLKHDLSNLEESGTKTGANLVELHNDYTAYKKKVEKSQATDRVDHAEQWRLLDKIHLIYIAAAEKITDKNP